MEETGFISSAIWCEYLRAYYVIEAVEPGRNPYRKNYLFTYDEYTAYMEYAVKKGYFIVSATVIL